jgi:hypothetical protein
MLLPWLLMLAVLIAALIYVGYNAKHSIEEHRQHHHHR